jgi:hypothetical protein
MCASIVFRRTGRIQRIQKMLWCTVDDWLSCVAFSARAVTRHNVARSRHYVTCSYLLGGRALPRRLNKTGLSSSRGLLPRPGRAKQPFFRAVRPLTASIQQGRSGEDPPPWPLSPSARRGPETVEDTPNARSTFVESRLDTQTLPRSSESRARTPKPTALVSGLRPAALELRLRGFPNQKSKFHCPGQATETNAVRYGW